MNWDAISAIGEATGAIAVLLTLIYLSIQVRHNTKIASADLSSRGQASFSRYREMCLPYASIILKARRGESLTEEEQYIVQSLCGEYAFVCATGYATASLLDSDQKGNWVNTLVMGIRSSKAFEGAWPEIRQAMDGLDSRTDFLADVESSLGA